jgi:hypothetical protein
MTDLDLDSPSQQLRVIRSLMERATIYRSLSAPTALVGGLLSFAGFGVAYWADRVNGVPLSGSGFLAVWLTILALTGLTNAVVLWREARRRGTPFFSSGMKCAFKSLLPPFICAAVLTIPGGEPVVQAILWVIFYGLGLLAMQHFAPRSLVVLGWTFLLAGLGLFIYWITLRFSGVGGSNTLQASLLMAATFGLFHILYALAIWVLGEERADTPAVTTTESGNV